MITGKDLIDWGFEPGPWFKHALTHANKLYVDEKWPRDAIKESLISFAPAPIDYLTRRDRAEIGFNLNLEAESLDEIVNAEAVGEHMVELMRVPTIKAGAVMPDACPAGSAKGTIPVGGVVACENAIHPGFHSADICCSMALTSIAHDVDLKSVLDAGRSVTHFGPGGRDDNPVGMSLGLLKAISNNPFTAPLAEHAVRHFATQGDGNHFFYVGRTKNGGSPTIVTHHGSRGFGARVYKAGMRVAEAMTSKIATGIPKHQCWIPADSQEGQDYWEALQILRQWTKENHYAIHNMTLRHLGEPLVLGRFWNEHNFVFRKPDGLFYHAKGATPAYDNFADDTIGLTLIPMNMSEPILITRGLNSVNGLGFAPHGAGRNLSRTGYLKSLGDKKPTVDIDVRWFSGTPDHSEMPGAYKNAESVRKQIKRFGLAEIVNEIIPYGCIMAGEIDWRTAGKTLGDLA